MSDKHFQAGDPPIIVGGGGSTYIWVLKTLGEPQLVANPPVPPYEFPFNKDLYNCYDVPVNLGSYKTHDGDNEGNSHRVKDRKKHGTRFFREA